MGILTLTSLINTIAFTTNIDDSTIAITSTNVTISSNVCDNYYTICTHVIVPLSFNVSNATYQSYLNYSSTDNVKIFKFVELYQNHTQNIKIFYLKKDPKQWRLNRSLLSSENMTQDEILAVLISVILSTMTICLFIGFLIFIMDNRPRDLNYLDIRHSNVRPTHAHKSSKRIKSNKKSSDNEILSDNKKSSDNEISDAPEVPVCKICFDQKIDTILTCGHTGCKKCLEECHSECPMCRAVIETLQPVYF